MKERQWQETWRRAVTLGAPATGQRAAARIISTADVFITAALSPAAVVALGVSAVYETLPGRINGGFVAGARTLVAQDTGAGATTNRDQALSQAAALSTLITIPFVVVGAVYGTELLGFVGAGSDAAQLGGTYLLLVLPTLPLGAWTSVAASALEATGDTVTPLYASLPVDLLNAIGSAVFGLGLFGAPQFGIIGVGGASLVARTTLFLILVSYVQLRSPITFRLPRNPRVMIQLFRIGLPRSVGGAAAGIALFPVNTVLFQLGETVNAGFQIAWRVNTQVISPVRQGLGVATGTIVGQQIGSERFSDARNSILALVTLGFGAAVLVGSAVVVGAEPLATTLTDDPAVIDSATGFIAVFGLLTVLAITVGIGQAALRAGSETRIPMFARLLGMFGGLVGVSWLLVVELGWGVIGVYVGLLVMYLLMLVTTAYGLLGTDWLGRAADMMAGRESTSE